MRDPLFSASIIFLISNLSVIISFFFSLRSESRNGHGNIAPFYLSTTRMKCLIFGFAEKFKIETRNSRCKSAAKFTERFSSYGIVVWNSMNFRWLACWRFRTEILQFFSLSALGDVIFESNKVSNNLEKNLECGADHMKIDAVKRLPRVAVAVFRLGPVSAG